MQVKTKPNTPASFVQPPPQRTKPWGKHNVFYLFLLINGKNSSQKRLLETPQEDEDNMPDLEAIPDSDDDDSSPSEPTETVSAGLFIFSLLSCLFSTQVRGLVSSHPPFHHCLQVYHGPFLKIHSLCSNPPSYFRNYTRGESCCLKPGGRCCRRFPGALPVLRLTAKQPG